MIILEEVADTAQETERQPVRDTKVSDYKSLAEALTNEGPSWIECRIDKDEKVLPMIPPGGTVQDITMTDDERGQV